MPKRPVSHQLEDVSRRRFEELLPASWVARTKSHDYGTDLEVEIFDEDGSATGNIFLVQLKATDDLGQADRLRLDVDHLDYFNSLDLPTLIVRYCRADDSVRTRWHFNVERPLDKYGTPPKTVAIAFSPADLWTGVSAGQVEQTLSVLRLIRTFPPSRPLALVCEAAGLDPARRYDIDEAIREVADAAPVLAGSPGDFNSLSIQVTAEAGRLRVGIDCVSQFSFDLESFDREAVANAILYGCAALLARHRFQQQASLVSQAILDLGRPCADKSVALAASLALGADPVEAARLAILNDLHRVDSVFGLLFITDLRLGTVESDNRNRAMLEFLDAVRACAVEEGDRRGEATAYYSMGNVHRSAGRHTDAVHAYNRARKARRSYLNAPYFLFETGSCLFLTGHYEGAACFYQEAAAAGQPDMAFVLGDALLFAGRVTEAQPHLQSAFEGPGRGEHHEVSLKLTLCQLLMEKYGPVLPLARSEARRLAVEVDRGGGPPNWKGIVDVDALNALANFNAGLGASEDNRVDDAWMHFIIAAFRMPNDTHAWVNAMLCAFSFADGQYGPSTMSCAVRIGGRDCYRDFRRLLMDQGAGDPLIHDMDDLNRALQDEIEAQRDRGLTVRLVGEGEQEVFKVQPASGKK